MPAPQLASPAFGGFGGAPAFGAAGFAAGFGAAAALAGGGVVGVAVAVGVEPAAAVEAGVAGAGVAGAALVASEGLSAGALPAPQLPLAEQLCCAAALGVVEGATSVDLAPAFAPPQPAMIAVVPSAAKVAANFSNDRFGRIEVLLVLIAAPRASRGADKVYAQVSTEVSLPSRTIRRAPLFSGRGRCLQRDRDVRGVGHLGAE